MFTDLKTDSASRLVEVRDFLDLINSLIPSPPIPTPNNLLTAKGLFYVHIYGVFEFTITSCIKRTIILINNENVNINDLQPLLLTMALNSEFDSLANVKARNWDCRWSLFEKIRDNSISQIITDLIPTDGKNIRYKQLESIWKTFCINSPILNLPSIGGRLKDIVDNRNAIAHGNTTSSEIGSRVTMNDLYNRYNEISSYCSYVIQVFEEYVLNKDYLK
ncbi:MULTISPECIES: MAE_28990/MAE_18760 family HEPN-like nuclease [Sphingobacterium]|uniref:RiboL-PSP-HEPN domain-containing protein n=1 Tax=Sphingobacterium multivorum TaxID=28454 RepID=A0A2X2JD05_SPHMU|nr:MULTISPECIES: MAE_28990/MAE_18760 family HEPN-like nuclease [Sphingobacterium]QRQ62104.1 hypothetical protein I6J33_03685 [Sphingobacterium multivorum]SPZ92257.1 Uncharacterised protein [Sphingobacterium multivorum]